MSWVWAPGVVTTGQMEKEWISLSRGPTHQTLPRSHVELSSMGSQSRGECSRLPSRRLSAPFADGMESRCFPLRKIEPTETMGPRQAASLSVVASLTSWKWNILLEVARTLELLITSASIPHPICWLPPDFFPFSPWSLMCAGKIK